MFVRTTVCGGARRHLACFVTASALLVSPAWAGPFSVIEEILVPGGPSVAPDEQFITSGSQLSSHSFRFSGRSAAEGGGAPIRNVVPLEGIGLPEEFGLVLDHSSEVPAFEGVTYQMSNKVRIDATWGFGQQQRSVEGSVDLHLSF